MKIWLVIKSPSTFFPSILQQHNRLASKAVVEMLNCQRILAFCWQYSSLGKFQNFLFIFSMPEFQPEPKYVFLIISPLGILEVRPWSSFFFLQNSPTFHFLRFLLEFHYTDVEYLCKSSIFLAFLLCFLGLFFFFPVFWDISQCYLLIH